MSEHPPTDTGNWRRLKAAAIVTAATHLAAGLAMLTVLRQGIDPNIAITERMAFLVNQTGLWVIGWLFWNAAALSFLFFALAFASAHDPANEERRFPLQLAALLVAAGIVADLSGEAIEMGVLPQIAARALAGMAAGESGQAATGLFEGLDRVVVMLTAFVANGLYSLAALILAWSTRAAHRPWVWAAGVGTGFIGLFLAAVAVIDWGTGLVLANALLVPCIVLWQGGVALDAARQARRSLSPPTVGRGLG
jgi:hypothetical protein